MKHAVNSEIRAIDGAADGAGHDPAQTAAAAGRRRPLGGLAGIAAFVLLAFSAAVSARQATPVAGVDYQVLPKPVRAAQGAGIEVVQVFSYACGACAKFDPAMSAWRAKLPRDVRFQYVPAAFGGAFDAAAKAYYAAKELGVADKTHAGIYRAVHVEQTLTGDSPEQVGEAYARLGVDRSRFDRAYRSDKTAERLRWARSYAIAAGVESTPTVLVAGKYRVAPKPGAPAEALLATVDYLIGIERRAHAKR